MDTPKHPFSTRVSTTPRDTDKPSPVPAATNPRIVQNRRMDGTRGELRDAAGGGGNDTDSVTRCPGATWEMAYLPLTCVTCGLHVCLHDMEIATRHFAARGLLFRGGRGRAGEMVPRIEPDRKQMPNRCPEPLAGDGRATMSQRSIRSAESESPQPPRRGSSDAANGDKPAYPVSYTGAGEGWPPPPLRSPRESRSRGGRGRGLRPSSPVPVRRDA